MDDYGAIHRFFNGKGDTAGASGVVSTPATDAIKQKLRNRVRTIYDGVGLPPVDCVCIYEPDDRDVRIVAHTFVAGRVAAVWQYGAEFGYGRDDQFIIDPEQ